MACAISILLISIFSCLSPNFVAYAQNDTLRQGQLLRDNEQLISAGGIFRLGFFSADSNVGLIGTAGARYLGIWFEHIPVYSVWVANRDTPVPDSSGGLTIGTDGKLRITYQGGPPIVINSDVESPESSGDYVTATLFDSGNLVIRRVDYDGKPAGPVLWQSFDYPHSRLLPGMRLRVNLKARKNWTLNSWSSEEVPAPIAFMLGLWARFFKLRLLLFILIGAVGAFFALAVRLLSTTRTFTSHQAPIQLVFTSYLSGAEMKYNGQVVCGRMEVFNQNLV